mmetsp:Transcript_97184/g.251410  ORF Transcript_97184/g.251410 Transcript_97184/m.251410 type:complete len:503 (-) Transcript_97184:585-2093(-)
MQDQVQLVARLQQGPILIDEVGEERLTAADVHDVRDSKHIEIVHVDRDGRRRRLLFLLRLCLALLALLLRLLLGHFLLLLFEEVLAPDRVLPHAAALSPLGQLLLPLAVLRGEPLPRLQVLDTHGPLLLGDPIFEELVAGGFTFPDIGDVIEALILGREGEACVRHQRPIGQIWELHLSVGQALLLLRQLDGGLLLFHLVLLFVLLLHLILRHILVHLLPCFFLPRGLLGLLGGLRLPPLLDDDSVPLLLLRLSPRLGGRLRALVRDYQLLHLGLVLRAGLAHQDDGPLFEALRRELREDGFALSGNEVGPELRHHEAPSHQRRDRMQGLARARVAERRDAKPGLGLVVGTRGCARLRLLPPDAALVGPLLDPAVAQLRVPRVLRPEVADPVEVAHFRQAHGQDHLAGALRLSRLANLRVGHGGVGQQAAGEGQRRKGEGAEVQLQSHVLVGDRGVQHLVAQVLRQGLRWRDSDTVPEQADGILVRAGGIQVQQHASGLAEQ